MLKKLPPFVLNLKQKKPEQIVLNKGKNIIKLNVCIRPHSESTPARSDASNVYLQRVWNEEKNSAARPSTLVLGQN
jgi:hypothetical protein